MRSSQICSIVIFIALKQGQQPVAFWRIVYASLCMKIDLGASLRILIQNVFYMFVTPAESFSANNLSKRCCVDLM